MRILSIDISTIAHATENLERVTNAFENILPLIIIPEIKFIIQHLRGHHGNPIIILKTKISKKKLINRFFNHIIERLDSNDLELIENNVNMYIDDEGHFYIRLDKQAAYLGKVELKQEDPIRIKIKVFNERSNKKSFEELVKGLIDVNKKVR